MLRDADLEDVKKEDMICPYYCNMKVGTLMRFSFFSIKEMISIRRYDIVATLVLLWIVIKLTNYLIDVIHEKNWENEQKIVDEE